MTRSSASPRLEAQPGNAEPPVLIHLVHVDRVVARLGDAPGHVALPAVLDLARDGGLAGLLQQRVLVAGQEQPRHEVLEHRAAPRHQAEVAAVAGEQAAESEPVLLRHLALRDQQVAGQAGFGGQQVVPGRIAPPLAHVVADAQQVARPVVEELEVHRRQVVTPGDQSSSMAFRRRLSARGSRLRQPSSRLGIVLKRLGFGHQRSEIVAESAALPVERRAPST